MYCLPPIFTVAEGLRRIEGLVQERPWKPRYSPTRPVDMTIRYALNRRRVPEALPV